MAPGDGEPLFSETISAWDMGPVVGQLWHAEKHGPAATVRLDLSERELNTVGYVLSRYGSLSGRDLESLTHSEQPWKLADAYRAAGQSVKIPIETIGEFFGSTQDWDETELPVDQDTLAAWLSPAPRRLHDSLLPDSIDSFASRAS